MDVVEIRTYTLKASSGAAFYTCVRAHVIPILERWGVDVVAYGLSRHDPDAAYLIRRYGSLDERERSHHAFYSSPEWQGGPRDAILSHITHYMDVVLLVDEQTLAGLRCSQ